MMKKVIKGTGLAMLGSVYYHSTQPKTYLTVAAISVGAALGTKSVKAGLTLGGVAAWGIIGRTGFDMIDSAANVVFRDEED